jgi:hypothetical protein
MARRFALTCALVLASTTAHALTQPNGATIPSPPGCSSGNPNGLAAVFACACTTPGVCNIGAPCTSPTMCDSGQHGTCETTLYHSYNDNTCIPSNLSGLDPAKSASLTPVTFHPSCGLTFTVLSRGTARFQNAFGWYNVTGSAPKSSDLHAMLDCHAAPGAKAVLDVKNDPAYTGGDIGFFIATPDDHAHAGSCASGDCCATVTRATSGQGWIYYSERQYNPDGAVANPFIHLVVYNSTLVAQKYYFAWEDTFGSPDTDFTDLVTSVDGVQCGGAGLSCDTGKAGLCGRGISDCKAGVLGCQPITDPQPEVCNGLDDDCNGKIDDGAPCPPGEVCTNGTCVPHCTLSQEFACPDTFSCDAASGLCVDPKCAGVTCPDGQVCRGGSCVGPCDGIVCPHGTECQKGACIDPCKSVTCSNGQVCVEGVCLPGCNQCGGVSCTSPLACNMTSGACADPSCPSGCPAGTYCNAGTCSDACAGAMCPPGQTCQAGACVAAGSMGGGGGGGGDGGGNGGVGGGGSNPSGVDLPGESGCGCGPMAKAQPAAGMHMSSLFAFLLLALFIRRRR